jgi:Domain of unknown function (DUF4267)
LKSITDINFHKIQAKDQSESGVEATAKQKFALQSSTCTSIPIKPTLSPNFEPIFKKMSTSDYRLQRVLPPLSSVIGILALGGGVYGIINPQACSNTLGIRVPTPTSPALPFVSFAGARNISSGLTVLALLYTGQRKAVGTLLMCGVAAAMTDAWICFQHDAVEGKAVGHAVMGVAMGLLGAGMYWG